MTISDDLPSGSFHEAVQSFKRELVRSALRMHSGNKVKAARELGISRCYLHRLLNQFKITDEGSAEYYENALELESTGAHLGAEELALGSSVV